MPSPAFPCRRLATPFALAWILLSLGAPALAADFQDLSALTSGRTRAGNALWIENPLTARFNTSNRVVVADLPGPAVITRLHCALPQSHFGQPQFAEGRWLEPRLGADRTAEGRVLVQARNERTGASAVVSILEWVEGN